MADSVNPQWQRLGRWCRWLVSASAPLPCNAATAAAAVAAVIVAAVATAAVVAAPPPVLPVQTRPTHAGHVWPWLCMWLHAMVTAAAYTCMCMVTRARSGTTGMTGSTPPGAEAVPYDQGMVLYPQRQYDPRPPGAQCECFPGGYVSSGRS